MRDTIHPCWRHGAAPHATLGLAHATVFEQLRAGGISPWTTNAMAVHSFTLPPYAGRSVALLGSTPSACGQVWHALPGSEAIPAGSSFACEPARKPFKLQVGPGVDARADPPVRTGAARVQGDDVPVRGRLPR